MKNLFWVPFVCLLVIQLGALLLESPNLFERVPFGISFVLAAFGMLLLFVDAPRVLRDAKQYFSAFTRK
jgi:hypothetical protein